MDAGLVEAQPDDQRQDPVREAPADRQASGEEDPAQGDERDDQRNDVQVIGVEHRDRSERPDVVDHGEREQEGPQPCRVLRRDDGEGAEQERGIGRDHRSPCVLSRAAVVQTEEDQRRQQQARDGGQRRHDCPAAIDQLPDDEIALHLEPDDEEEERHQPVVDQVSQRQLEVGTADGDLEGRCPEHFVRPGGEVRPQQRQHRPRQQQGGRGLVGAEVSPHPAQSIDQLLRAPRTVMGGGISVVRTCFAPVAPLPDAACPTVKRADASSNPVPPRP